MKTSIKRAVGVALAAAGLAISSYLFAAAPAMADDYGCNGTVNNRVVKGNIKIRSGATCNIVNSIIEGDIEVNKNARLNLRQSIVTGNIEIRTQAIGTLINNRIGNEVFNGTVRILTNAAGYLSGNRMVGYLQGQEHGMVYAYGNVVEGSIQIKVGNKATIESNRVDTDVYIMGNRGYQVVRNNRISGYLWCWSNLSLHGGGNIVGGTRRLQCLNL